MQRCGATAYALQLVGCVRNVLRVCTVCVASEWVPRTMLKVRGGGAAALA